MNLENSLYKVVPSNFQKTIEVPTSKSYSNRALILGALRGNGFSISNLSESTDTQNLLMAFEKMGIRTERRGAELKFLNSFPACEDDLIDEVIDLKTGDGGTTNRFLIALLSRGKKTYRLFPSEKMSERPIDELMVPLRELGVTIEKADGGPWLTIKGPACISEFKTLTIDCSKSTQFASAMLLAFHNTKIKFSFKNLNASETYLRMTEAIIQDETHKVPADFSSMSYPIALALISGSVTISNCFKVDPFQADAIFIDLIQNSGGDLEFTSAGLKVSSKKILKPFVLDGSKCPDLIPTLAFLASSIEGESRLENLGILRHKESDRIEEILNLLKTFQVAHTFVPENSSLLIRGARERKAPHVSYTPARDHRMVMVAYLFMRANNGGLLGHADCVKKSYPKFFEEME